MGRITLNRRVILKALAYIVATVGAVVFLFPFLWMVAGSFKAEWEMNLYPPSLFPQQPTLMNYPTLFERFPMLRLYANSLFVTAVTVIAQVITSGATGYVFCKFDFPGKRLIFVLVLSTMMVPFFVTMVPLFVMVAGWGWVDRYLALIVPALYSSFGIFLIQQYANTIPDELLDAARIDGASEARIFAQVAFPILGPALGALGIFTFLGSWGSYMWPLAVITKPDRRTLPLALATLVALEETSGGYRPDVSRTGVLLAGNTVAVVPVLLVFFRLQRYITEGVALTGLGGH